MPPPRQRAKSNQDASGRRRRLVLSTTRTSFRPVTGSAGQTLVLLDPGVEYFDAPPQLTSALHQRVAIAAPMFRRHAGVEHAALADFQREGAKAVAFLLEGEAQLAHGVEFRHKLLVRCQ